MYATVCHSTFQSMHHRVAILMDRISLAAIGDACKKMARHFFIRIGCLPAAPRRWLYFAAQNKPDAATVSKRSSVFSKSRYWKRDKGPIVFIGNWNRTHTQTHSDQGDSLRAVCVCGASASSRLTHTRIALGSIHLPILYAQQHTYCIPIRR